MISHDQEVTSGPGEVEREGQTGLGVSSKGGRSGLFHPRALAIMAGLLCGLAAFGLGEAFYGWFPPKAVPQMLSGAQVMLPSVETIAVADARNSALSFAFLGGGLGLFFGLAGGLGRRSGRWAVTAGLIGLVLGAILGACLPLLLVVPYIRMQDTRNSDDLLVPMGMHAALWGPLGAVAGLAFGIGLGPGHRLRPLIFALVGACLGTAVFEVVGAAIDPLAV